MLLAIVCAVPRTRGSSMWPARASAHAAPQPRGLLLAGDRQSDLVLQDGLAQHGESFRIALALPHNFGVGAVLDRWACRLEQPGQRQPMGCREFQGLAPR